MKKLLIVLLLVSTLILGATAQTAAEISDVNFWNSRYTEDLKNLKEAWKAPNLDNTAKFDIAWRISRAIIMVANDAERLKQMNQEQLQAEFIQAQDWATQAVNLNPKSSIGYYWQGASLGRWAEIKSIFKALNKSPEMKSLIVKGVLQDSTYADHWYLAGQLYAKLPGAPMSFGNKNFAVSADRYSVAVYKPELPYFNKGPKYNTYYYIELARHLFERNWSADTRLAELPAMKTGYANAKDAYEKGLYFEGTVNFDSVPVYANLKLSQMSDRDEARAVCKWAIAWLKTQDQKVWYITDHIRQLEGLQAKYK